MKKLLLLAATLLLVLVAGGAWWLIGERPTLPEHQVYLNGLVLTMDRKGSVAQAVSIRGDRIDAVGDNAAVEALITDHTVVHDLAGRTLIPGFIDAHGHFPGTGLGLFGVDLNSPPIGDVETIAELQASLRARAQRHPEIPWLFGFGYDDTLLAEKRHPTRADLDAVSKERPIFILHISGHMGVANSAALAAAGIDRDTPDPAGGVIVRNPRSGEPTGLLEEHAMDAVSALAMDFSALDFLRMADYAARQYLAAGVTTAQSGGVDSAMLQGLNLLSRLRRVPQRLEVWPLGNELGAAIRNGELRPEDYHRPHFQADTVKLIADGSLQGYTGYLTAPYHLPPGDDPDFRGYPRIEPDQLKEQVLAYHKAGWQLALHGNGDAAIDQIIEAFRHAQREYPREDARPIVIHAQTAREDQLVAMQELGMTPSFFSAHTYYWGDRHRDVFLGPERAARISPTRSAAERGLRFSVHLDSPVVPMDPLLLVWSTVNRETASGAVLGGEQRVDVMQALRAVTIDAAWQIQRDAELGSIEPGKLADLVILSADPRDNPGTIRQLHVERTIIGGRTYYSTTQ